MRNIRNVFIGIVIVIGVIGVGYLLLIQPAINATGNDGVEATAIVELPTPTLQTFEIVDLLPPDAILAIDQPEFYSVVEADKEYDPNEMVLGVSINRDSRAYSTSFLERHEIVNDEVGGRKIAVTW